MCQCPKEFFLPCFCPFPFRMHSQSLPAHSNVSLCWTFFVWESLNHIFGKNYQQTWKRKRFFNLIKNIYKKLIPNILFHCEKLDIFPLKSRTKHIFPVNTPIKLCTRNPSWCNDTRQAKVNGLGRKLKLSLFKDIMIIQMDNLKESTKHQNNKKLQNKMSMATSQDTG